MIHFAFASADQDCDHYPSYLRFISFTLSFLLFNFLLLDASFFLLCPALFYLFFPLIRGSGRSRGVSVDLYTRKGSLVSGCYMYMYALPLVSEGPPWSHWTYLIKQRRGSRKLRRNHLVQVNAVGDARKDGSLLGSNTVCPYVYVC